MKKLLRHLSNWFTDPQHLIAVAGFILAGFLGLSNAYRGFWLLVLTNVVILLCMIVLFISGIMIVKQEYYQFANVHFGGKSGVIWGVTIMILSVLAFILTTAGLIDLLSRHSR